MRGSQGDVIDTDSICTHVERRAGESGPCLLSAHDDESRGASLVGLTPSGDIGFIHVSASATRVASHGCRWPRSHVDLAKPPTRASCPC